MDENILRKRLRALKKYCPKAYKYLIFNLNENTRLQKDGTYEVELHTSKEFQYVYGQIKVIYELKGQLVNYIDIQPSQFLEDGYRSDLDVYKGMFYRDARDKFKIDLMYAYLKV